ncbi:MAG: hypothetical protein ACI8RD_003582, partial [Bacillariaceae sp.]
VFHFIVIIFIYSFILLTITDSFSSFISFHFTSLHFTSLNFKNFISLYIIYLQKRVLNTNTKQQLQQPQQPQPQPHHSVGGSTSRSQPPQS